MAAEPRRAPVLSLQQVVAKYQSLAGDFGNPATLSGFGLTKAETEQLFSDYNEDYHISRFFDFTEVEGEKYSINDVPATHLSIDSEVQTIL
jgi:hypothetical protein